MFSKEELIIIKESVSNEEIIKKIDGMLNTIDNCKEYLWSFYWDYGRQGEVEGIFKATEEEVENAIGKEVFFGEILGKHSEVYGELEREDFTLESSDPIVVMNAVESGYNPLEYLS